MVSKWDEATTVRRLDSHSYQVSLRDNWSNSTVPHGGYVVSCFLRAVNAHFCESPRRDQSHTVTAHVEFLRRAQVGPAKVVIKDVKLGRRLSTVHVTLVQHGVEEIVGYVTRADLGTMQGMSINTGWDLHPRPHDADLSKLRDGQDDKWVEPYQGLVSHKHVRAFTPSRGQFRVGMVDQWICLREGFFTNETLGYVADVFYVEPDFARFSFATLILDLETKRAIPSGGLEWLFMRTTMKELRNGKIDVEILIMNAAGELIAVSHHVTLVADMSQSRAGESGSTPRLKI